MSTTPRALPVAHLGISVPDLGAAIDWYRNVMGFRLMTEPGEILIEDGGHFAELCADIFGPQLKRLKMAHIATANGTALELFEFVDPAYEAPADNFRYWGGGIFHFCVVDPDVEGLVERITTTGGRQRSKVWTVFEGQPYKAVYCEDPWGTIVEIYSHNHESTFANQ